MCGIGGYYAFGDIRPRAAEIETLLKDLQNRGSDATGLAYLRAREGFETELCVLKAPIPAKQMVASTEYREFMSEYQQDLPKSMILHTRAGTKGSEKNNMNNHPLFDKGSGIVMVHNGVISNDDYLFKKYELDRDAQVDSEIILKIVPGFYDDKDNVNKLQGRFACAALCKSKPDDLWLFRSGNPIDYYMDTDRDILYFASSGMYIENAMQHLHRGFKCGGKVTTYSMPDDRHFLISPEGIKSIDVIKIDAETEWRDKGYSYGGNCVTHDTWYEKRKREWQKTGHEHKPTGSFWETKKLLRGSRFFNHTTGKWEPIDADKNFKCPMCDEPVDGSMVTWHPIAGSSAITTCETCWKTFDNEKQSESPSGPSGQFEESVWKCPLCDNKLWYFPAESKYWCSSCKEYVYYEAINRKQIGHDYNSDPFYFE